MRARIATSLLALLLAACSASTPATSSPRPSGTVTPSTAPAASPTPTDPRPTASASPSATIQASVPVAGSGPPAAQLLAEGGEPVTAQLGTYVWHDAGSDSPWLSGAPIAVGHGEPLSVTFTPRAGVAAWQARTVPAARSGPAGATFVGEGTGLPRFDAPGAGTWTLEVHVVFTDDAGDASYFWRLDVT